MWVRLCASLAYTLDLGDERPADLVFRFDIRLVGCVCRNLQNLANLRYLLGDGIVLNASVPRPDVPLELIFGNNVIRVFEKVLERRGGEGWNVFAMFVAREHARVIQEGSEPS